VAKLRGFEPMPAGDELVSAPLAGPQHDGLQQAIDAHGFRKLGYALRSERPQAPRVDCDTAQADIDGLSWR
jgi:hypothetical protein